MKKKEINYQLLIRRICLIVLDIICIIAASILALLTRFEFDFSQIPKEFLKVIYKYGPFTIVITLIIFSLFRIYSSLWEYAGIEEVFSLIAACLVAAVAKIVIILFTWSVMPRSWYVLDTIYLMILIGATRVSYRLIRLRRQNRTFPWSKRKKVMIIGGGDEWLGGYHACGTTHEASTTDDFLDGYYIPDSGKVENVIIWRGKRGNNIHCTTNLNRDSWETTKS